ncbi:MAG: tRNA uridine-5-carboxymethylaminomethyl(34) synthesis GTPase MnmE [Clostridia bacterium]|nr:tRNA uridine-5-carboxymethylaminomethyl(34) synthesis GTPase MnmE [Clostridia bacterium]
MRISGSEALSIAERVFRAKSGKSLSDYPARFQIYGSILSSDGIRVLDDGLLTYFAAPHSFTGEDVVEIACHGGEMITSMVLSALLESGATMASAGEFTRRAFMNGKLSLTAAEGVADLLDARTEEAALLSSKTVRGRLSCEIERITARILEAASSLWAYLDYPEDDLQSFDDDALVSLLSEVLRESEALLHSYRTGRAISSGIPAVIAGKPNVGKSTLFNRLLGEDRAIVTSVPGTTRDVIEYPLKLGRVLLNLSDTAGVREDASDLVEEIGIEKAVRAVSEAEVIFFVLDRSREFSDDDKALLSAVLRRQEDALVIPVLNKCDLPSALDLCELPFEKDAYFSCGHDLLDIDELVRRVEERFISDESALREGRVITNARQRSALICAISLLKEAIDQIRRGDKDVASLTLESALAAFLEIDGKSAGEKILNEVFSRFCVGK